MDETGTWLFTTVVTVPSRGRATGSGVVEASGIVGTRGSRETERGHRVDVISARSISPGGGGGGGGGGRNVTLPIAA